jgi:hypothetical protein
MRPAPARAVALAPALALVLALALAHCSRTGLLIPEALPDGAAPDAPALVDVPDEILPPRPIAPLSTGFATSRTPTFRWALPPGTDGASVQLCRDRACTRELVAFTASGTQAPFPRASGPLAPGVTFWRMRGTRGGRVGTAYSPTWQFTVGAQSAAVDTSWGSRMDVNGDGYGDLIVSDREVGGRTGRLYIYLGGPQGPTPMPSATFDGPDGPQGQFGAGVHSAGDVDGDGFGDVTVAAPYLGGTTGRAYVLFGSAAGLRTDVIARLDPPATMQLTAAVAGLGDVDADGYADVAVGIAAPSMQPNPPGAVMVFRGGATGPSAAPTWTLAAGDDMHSFYGLRAAGDVNGDGFSDVVAPAGNFNPTEGRAYLYLGGPAGLQASNVYRFRGMPLGYYGAAAPAGDVNGDGYVDLLTGGSGTSLYSGWVELYLAGAQGVATNPQAVLGDTGEPYGFLTGDLDTTGDLDGDGLDDFAVGASVGNNESGRVTVFYGDRSGTPTRHTELLGAPTPPGGMWLAHLGEQFAGPNDFDGDGLSDLAVSAYGQREPSGAQGVVVIYHGAPGGLAQRPWITLVNPSMYPGEYGLELALMLTSCPLGRLGASPTVAPTRPLARLRRSALAGDCDALDWPAIATR